MSPATRSPSSEQDVRVWRALAEPARRRLLDLLSSRPERTADLAARFATSRFAVMKHLAVLEGAGLIAVERRGRERWNHLNAAPLAAIQERWVRPLAAAAAARLMRLGRRAERGSRPHSPPLQEVPMNAAPETAAVVRIEVELRIAAPRERVWTAFVAETDDWWRPDFRTDSRSRRVVLEAALGGRLYEDYGGGDGLLWMSVVLLKRGERIDFVGHSGPDWGGPSTGYHSFQFTAKGRQTQLRLSETHVGHVSEDTRKSLEDGWKLLLGEGLKPYAEGRGR